MVGEWTVGVWKHTDSWLKMQIFAILNPNTNAQRMSFWSHVLRSLLYAFVQNCYSFLLCLYFSIIPSCWEKPFAKAWSARRCHTQAKPDSHEATFGVLERHEKRRLPSPYSRPNVPDSRGTEQRLHVDLCCGMHIFGGWDWQVLC